MGCGCSEDKKTPSSITLLHPTLDRIELLLQQAWISEVRGEQRELVKQLILAIQALKHPYVIPLEAQLQNLLEASSVVVAQINCRYCRKHAYHDLVDSVLFSLELEKHHYWHAFKIIISKEVRKTYWLLRAIL